MNESGDAFFDQEARTKLGQTVKAWMDAAGKNKRTLAHDTGMSRTTLDAILSGSRETSLELVARLAATLKVSAGALIDGQLPAGGAPVFSPLTPPTNAPDHRPALESRVDALERQLLSTTKMAQEALALGQQLQAAKSSDQLL